MGKISKFKIPIIAILISSFILVWGDFLFIHWVQLENKFPSSIISHWGQTSLFLTLIYWVYSRTTYFIGVWVLLIFSFFQWMTLTYYGTYLSPMMIYLFFSEAGEVFETFLVVWPTLFKPLIVFVIGGFFLGLLQWGLQKYSKKDLREININLSWRNSSRWIKSKKIMNFLILFLLIYPIPRTFITGHTFGKQARVQDLSFVNFYGAFSYFAGRILPAKVSAKNLEPVKVKVPKIVESKPQRHVIFILGESLGLRHLQIFGYPKSTTPWLQGLLNHGDLHLRRGVSGGVSTDVSIPMLFHGTHGMEAAGVIASQQRCLFRLAKENGFQTSFISVQTQENLQHISNFLCPKFLDRFVVSDNETTVDGESTVLDGELLKGLESVDFKLPQFLVLHQRGSHSPYERRYPKNLDFIKVDSSETWGEQQIKHYDNSVYYTDQILSKIVDKIRAHSQLPVEIVFTSDHGEALGEGQQWGHVILLPMVAEVPILYLPGKNSEIRVKNFEEHGLWIDHLFFSEFIQYLLGYEEPVVSSLKQYMVMGADLDGLGGFMWVQPVEGQLESGQLNK